MNIYLVNSDDKYASSLMKKLSDTKPGQIIPLTDGEMELYRSSDFQEIVTDRNNNPVNIAKMEKGCEYVAVVKKGYTVIDDLVNMGERLGIKLAIVRTR